MASQHSDFKAVDIKMTTRDAVKKGKAKAVLVVAEEGVEDGVRCRR